MEIKKILVIRFRRIGDSVISSTLCSSLKRSFPEAEVHYILNEHIAPLFYHHPDIDKIIPFSTYEMENTFRYIKKVRKTVKEEKYDMIIDTRSTIKTSMFSIFSFRTKYRIGRLKSYNYFIHNYRIDNSYKGDKDNAKLTLSLLTPLEKIFNIKIEPEFKLYYTQKEASDYRAYMQSKGIDFSKPIIVCAVAVRLEYKAWPKDKMRDLLQKVIDKYDVQLIFNFGDNKEKETALEIRKQLNYDKHIFIDIEANNLRELIALLANSSFFFGNEGGVRHISQALGIPSLAIFPPSVPLNNWLPNRSEKYQGIELADINPQAAYDKKLSFEEKMALIDLYYVWKKLDTMLQDNLKSAQFAD